MKIYDKSWLVQELIDELSCFKEDMNIYLNVGYQEFPTIGKHRHRTIIGFGSDEFKLKTVGAFIDKLKTLQRDDVLFTFEESDYYDDDTDWNVIASKDNITLFTTINVIILDENTRYIVLSPK